MTVLDDILALAVTKDQANFLRNGGFIPREKLKECLPPSTPEGQIVRAMESNKLIALCELGADQLKPVRVFNL